MIPAAILDSGPLVALVNRKDQHHAWAKAAFSKVRPPLLTCEAVLSEAGHLLSRARVSSDTLLEFLRTGFLDPVFRARDERAALTRLMKQYADVPMSFADASVLRLYELTKHSPIMTTDTDFLVYRAHSAQVIKCIAPFAEAL